MKDIKIIFSIVVLFFAMNSCEKTEQDIYENCDGRFVRFTLMLDNDGLPVDNSMLNPQATIVSEFSNRKKETLAIPVSLTSEPLENEVTVSFSIEITGNYPGINIAPANQLTFSGSQLTDTIFINFTERWNAENDIQIKLKLESSSDPEIMIGMPNELDAFNELTIDLEELFLRYQFPAGNLFELNGEQGETISFSVLFPDGYFPSEIDPEAILNTVAAEFDYSITSIDAKSDRIDYELTLNETLDNDNFTYTTKFELRSLEGYILSGSNKITIVKPERAFRDVSLNTAAHFYNLDNPFYRNYGENWMYDNGDGICEWQSFNSFTYPVVVDAEDPNAILYDDMGTTDPSDDVYHHAFRIGFNSPNAGRTTNAFNLKRWFENESSDSDGSPGFNIQQALEFYPEGGTSSTTGQVRVIPQEIMISNIKGDSYFIEIEGEGEYEMISDDVYKITFELRATNRELFGGTQKSQYVLFNTDDYPEPEVIQTDCVAPVDL